MFQIISNFKLSKIKDLLQNRNKFDKAQRKALVVSPLFDETYYRKNAAELGYDLSGADAVSHYIEFGDKNRLATHPVFDTKYYYQKYPDLVGMPMTALYHFLEYGARESRSPHPFIDPHYIIEQIGHVENNYLLKFISSNPGSINPHPLIESSFVISQLGYEVAAANPFYLFERKGRIHVNPSPRFDAIEYAKYAKISLDRDAFSLYLAADKLANLDANNLPAQFAAVENQIEEIIESEPSFDLQDIKISEVRAARAAVTKHDHSRVMRIIDRSITPYRLDHLFFVGDLGDPKVDALLLTALESIIQKDSGKSVCIMLEKFDHNASYELLERLSVVLINLDDLIDDNVRAEFPELMSIYFQTINLKNIHVLESYIGWAMFENYGNQLSQFMKLHAHAVGYQRDTLGRKYGFAWTHLHECKTYLHSINTVSAELIQDLERELDVSELATCALKLADSERKCWNI